MWVLVCWLFGLSEVNFLCYYIFFDESTITLFNLLKLIFIYFSYDEEGQNSHEDIVIFLSTLLSSTKHYMTKFPSFPFFCFISIPITIKSISFPFFSLSSSLSESFLFLPNHSTQTER